MAQKTNSIKNIQVIDSLASIDAMSALSANQGRLLDEKKLDKDAIFSFSTIDHNHAGVYEPADDTIIKEEDIGDKVAGINHEHNDTYSPASHNHCLSDLLEKNYNSLDNKPDLSAIHLHINQDILNNTQESFTHSLKTDYDQAYENLHSHHNLDELDNFNPDDYASSTHNHEGLYEPCDATLLREGNVSSEPNPSQVKPISSEWAYYHEKNTNAHINSIKSINEHTFSIPGEIKPTNNNDDYIPGFFVHIPNGSFKRLTKMYAVLKAGSNCIITVKQNGAETQLNEKTISTIKSEFDSSISMNNGDYIELAVLAVNGDPRGLSCTLVVEESCYYEKMEDVE